MANAERASHGYHVVLTDARFTADQVNSAIEFVINDCAIDRGRTVRYTAVFEAAELPPPQELHHGGESEVVTAFMKAFHDECHDRGLPPLDALVVHVTGKREGRPGAGYFSVNGHADPFSDSTRVPEETIIAANAFWDGQKQLVAEWGTKHRRGLA